MAPLQNMSSSSVSSMNEEEPSRPSSTHRTLGPELAAIAEGEEDVDSTSRTHHESAMDLGSIDEKEEEEAALPEQPQQRKSVICRSSSDIASKTGAKVIPAGVQRKVAELAARAYRKASARSNVLSKAKFADIALVRFDEIEVGEFLGKGSFSSVHEITRVSCNVDVTDCDDQSWDGDEEKADAKTVEFLADKSDRADDARRILTTHYVREETGTCRYAVKFLKEQVRAIPQKYAVGTADLVLEGMFLASLNHPNIVKVRGLPEGGVKSLVKGSAGNNGYFLVLDRLFDTLSDRIYKVWGEEHRTTVRKKYGFFANKEDKQERNDHMAVRLKVAFDISAAIKYLHSKNIIYRDLKPENLGFDVRGDIKLFDLGLVKELHPSEADRYGNYKMSMAGTPRYMAPECGLYQPYNLSADVYSYSMLLYEILSLVKPLKDYTYTQLKNEIFIEGDRPPLRKVHNKRMRRLISNGWDYRPEVRPTMDEVYGTVKAEYIRLAPDGVTEAQVSHNRRRSTYVAQRVGSMTMKQLMRLNTADSAANSPDKGHDAGPEPSGVEL